MEADQTSTNAPACLGCLSRDRRIAQLEQRNTQLEQRIQQMEKRLEELIRSGKGLSI